MAVPICNRFSVLADVADSSTCSDPPLKRRANSKTAAPKTSTTDGGPSAALSSAFGNGDVAKSRHNDQVTRNVPAAAKGSSFKAAQMASLERFNKMIAAKYPDLKADIELPEEFTCAVCWQIMVRPTHCIPCKHCFCEPCLRSVSFVANGRFRSLCPLCRQSIRYTIPNQDLEMEMRSGDHVTAAGYEKRRKWLKQQHNIAKMPLPGFAPLRWVSRVCPWSGPRASKFVDFAERQLFDQFASFTLQLDEDHNSRAPPVLTTIIDLLLVLFFYFAVPPHLSVDIIEAVRASIGMQAWRTPELRKCLVDSIDSSILYLLPFSELQIPFVVLFWALYITLVLRDFFRFVFRQVFASLRHDGAGIGWYVFFALLFLWSQILACEYLAKHMRWITSAVPHADSKAGFACILLGLTLLLSLNTIVTNRAVKVVPLVILVGAALSFNGFCIIKIRLGN